MKRFWISIVVGVLVSSANAWASAGSAAASTTRVAPQFLIRVASSPVVYVEGTVTCKQMTCQELLRTNNSGKSLTEVTMPPTPSSNGTPDGPWDQIIFGNADDGFALRVTYNSKGVNTGSALYATDDGARTWKRQRGPKGGVLTSITVTSNMLYGVTMHCSMQPVGDEGCLDYRLVRTSLSVKHWSSTAIPNGRSYPWGFLGNVTAYGSMVWMSEGAKWSLLVSSQDHGTTFNTRTPKRPALGSIAGCQLTAFSTSTLWAACPTGMEVSFFFSRDAGVTWTTVPTGQFMGTGGGFFDPTSSTVAFMSYRGRQLYRVTDSGHRLTKVAFAGCSSIDSSASAITFSSARDGMAICSQRDLHSPTLLERTTDGGATWSRVDLGGLASLRA